MDMKEFKVIDGFEDYAVNRLGDVLSTKKYGGNYRILKQNKDRKYGYKYVTLMKDKKAVTKKIHRLVAEAFIPKPDGKKIINHKDGNKSNNRCDNLEWVTHSENTNHSYANGLQPVGENHAQAKFSDAEISKVFELRKQGLTQVEIGKSLGMSQSHVSAVLRKRLRAYDL